LANKVSSQQSYDPIIQSIVDHTTSLLLYYNVNQSLVPFGQKPFGQQSVEHSYDPIIWSIVDHIGILLFYFNVNQMSVGQTVFDQKT
jgi:hypothetical protein